MSKEKRISFKVGGNHVNQRLDVVLAKKLVGYSRRHIAKQIKEGKVMIDGRKAVKPKTLLQLGGKVEASIAPIDSKLVAEDIPVKIIYKDKDLAVIDKPAGLVMHPAGRHQQGTLANALKHELKKFYLVHRLDKDTSGIVLVARNTQTRDFLRDLFAQRLVTKQYAALLKGRITPESAQLDLPIRRGRSAKFEVASGGRAASSFYKVKEYIGRRYSLVEVYPKSGRTHQIRVHFKAVGHPVVGDTIYGSAEPGLGRQFLHAAMIEFKDQHGKVRRFKSPLPYDLKDFLKHAEE